MEASDEYNLILKTTEEEEVETIATGSFDELKNQPDIFTKQTTWTPSVNPDEYEVSLNMLGLTWVLYNDISASAGGGGIIFPEGTIKVVAGTDKTFTIIPDIGYEILDVLVDGLNQGPIVTHTFTDVDASHTIVASFTEIVYTITSSAGIGGSIDPLGETNVTHGQSQTFTATADDGYTFDSWLIDTIPTYTLSTHTIENVVADHTIVAQFSLILANMGTYDYVPPTQFADRIGNGGCLFDGIGVKSYIPGTPVNIEWTLNRQGSGDVWGITFRIDLEIVGGGEPQTVVIEKTIAGPWPVGSTITITESFNAPAGGTWVTRLHIIEVDMSA